MSAVTKNLTTALAKIQSLEASVATTSQFSFSKYDPKLFRPYCWTHGFRVNRKHNSVTCRAPADGHNKKATAVNRMGGSEIGLNDVIEE